MYTVGIDLGGTNIAIGLCDAELKIIDKISVGIFIVDYILRWSTADFLFKKKSPISFLKYPFTVMAIIDLVLPSWQQRT